MMSVTETTTYTMKPIYIKRCDFCNEIVETFDETRCIVKARHTGGDFGIVIKVFGFGPGDEEPDICTNCADKAILEIANRIKITKKQESILDKEYNRIIYEKDILNNEI